ncbi:biotin transporter BioY [Cellulomonas cellasea]|uniref:Biotin transporter n=2 Tax=Cellulomonas cellasea TaxID=43670 RepID=A0A0A0B6Q4_9CELL|nr:biotin transporter BioY [Cellulomonas cellasea]KGM02510.1 biotin biosynthesis protein BioY [Cellulomonas cellasea DSM 20118]GEA88716.1 biotin biosynthesis protein BioY [Cellulomonas cellasea]
MTTVSLSAPRPHVLADLVPAVRARAAVDAALVVTGTLFIAAFAQLTITLPFTPVPISLSTLAVLLGGAALGARRGALSVLLYIACGVLGAPFYADGNSGWAIASFGYILGYLPASALAGYLARRGADRGPVRAFGAVVLASAVVYLGGVPWLMAFLDVDLATAAQLGVWPFLVGDTIKAVLVALALPGAWRLLGRHTGTLAAAPGPAAAGPDDQG